MCTYLCACLLMGVYIVIVGDVWIPAHEMGFCFLSFLVSCPRQLGRVDMLRLDIPAVHGRLGELHVQSRSLPIYLSLHDCPPLLLPLFLPPPPAPLPCRSDLCDLGVSSY